MKLTYSTLTGTMVGQMALILISSFTVLLGVLSLLEVRDSHTALHSANDPSTLKRLKRIVPVMNSIKPSEAERFLASVSSCHDGYTLSNHPYPATHTTRDFGPLIHQISKFVSLAPSDVTITDALLTKRQFSYSECEEEEINFPIDGIVISVKLSSERWLNTEIHPHEWHFGPSFHTWLVRSSVAFMVIGIIALIFLHQVTAPLRVLTHSTSNFDGENSVPVIDEKGPPDVKRAITAFNQMQSRIVAEMQNRLSMLGAISHDLRTPLTSLRVKSELISEANVRSDIIDGLNKIESLVSSALEFLRSGAISEPRRKVSIASLVESECADQEDLGASITFHCEEDIELICYPNALGRAVGNLIENAVKHAFGAHVLIQTDLDFLTISVIDTGPGIEQKDKDRLIQPFERLSKHREKFSSGFGLGLSIVNAVAKLTVHLVNTSSSSLRPTTQETNLF